MFGVSEKIYNFVVYIKNKLMRKRQPKQDPSYMLFIFGDFKIFLFKINFLKIRN